jgi:membrane protease YdiL (CAAX protease family)
MKKISQLSNSKIGAFILFAISFSLIYNPFTKFPFTFCIIILSIFLFTYIQDKNIKALNFKRLTLRDAGFILLIYLAVEILMDFVFQPLTSTIFKEPADYSAFDALKGNTSKYIKYLIFMWISAAFGEELLFRAFAFSQIKKVIGNKNLLIVIISAVLFSLPHLYQGSAGLIMTFLFGLTFGFIYYKFKNIWINIIVHGLIDSLFLTLAYLDLISFYSWTF